MTPHTNPITYGKMLQKNNILTKLIRTPCSLQDFLQRNTIHVVINYQTLEELLISKTIISEYNLLSDIFVYIRLKYKNIFA